MSGDVHQRPRAKLTISQVGRLQRNKLIDSYFFLGKLDGLEERANDISKKRYEAALLEPGGFTTGPSAFRFRWKQRILRTAEPCGEEAIVQHVFKLERIDGIAFFTGYDVRQFRLRLEYVG